MEYVNITAEHCFWIFAMEQDTLEMVSVWLKAGPKGNNLFQRTHCIKGFVSNIQMIILET